MHKTESSGSEFNSVLKKRSELDISLEKQKSIKEKISAMHFSRHDSAGKERMAHSESQSGSSSTFSGRSEEERIEEILMTQKNSNNLPIDSFVAGLHQVNNNDYAAEPVQVEKKEENLNDSFEEDEYVEEEEEEGDGDGFGGSSKNRRSSALHKNYYIRLQVPPNQLSSNNGNGNGNEKENSSTIKRSVTFTLFSKYSGMSTCYVYGENGRQ